MVHSLRLSISLRVISRHKVEPYTQCLGQGLGESRYELQSVIRCDMERDAMFREYLRDEQGSKGSRVEGVGYWYEDGLCKGDWVQDSRRILSYITICDYDTTYLQENPQRLG